GSGEALRQVCAETRALFLEAAAAKAGVDSASLAVEDGTIVDGDGRAVATYWELTPAVPLDRDATGRPKPKPAAARRLVGTAVPRTDIAGKIGGARSFVHDLVFDGMLHGRAVRPPSPGAVLVQAPDVPRVVAIVRDGTFLGVIAEREEAAVAA